jgi:uncharacterized membrane protein
MDMFFELFTFVIVTSSEPTYKDVKPLFEKHCAQCHNANWPSRNWLDEKTAKTYASQIRYRLENKTMPPGNFTKMTQEERDKIIDWVKKGAK